MTATATTVKHETTVTTQVRQLGRSRVTDHLWFCSCGERGKAFNGFSTHREAWVDALGHQPQNQRR
jgi:hypothetical protein